MQVQKRRSIGEKVEELAQEARKKHEVLESEISSTADASTVDLDLSEDGVERLLVTGSAPDDAPCAICSVQARL